MALAVPIIVGLLGSVVWRSGTTWWNLLIPHALPHAEYSLGSAAHCTRITGPGFAFCEDITDWSTPGQHKLIASCDPERMSWNTVTGPMHNPGPRGSLFVYDYSSAAAGTAGQGKLQPVLILGMPATADFHPLGIDIFSEGTSHTLFVVNHGRNESTVELFTLSPNGPYTATHKRTVSGLDAPNSIAAISPTAFYATEDHGLPIRKYGAALAMTESMLALPLGRLSLVDLAAAEPKITRLRRIAFANGVALTRDGHTLAVASSSTAEVYFYNRTDLAHPQLLTLNSTIRLPFAPDNVTPAPDGRRVLVAGHPNFPAFTARSQNSSTHAPSWVAALDPEAAKEDAVETLYRSDGAGPDGYQTSTTALLSADKKRFFVTGLYAEDGVLDCPA